MLQPYGAEIKPNQWQQHVKTSSLPNFNSDARSGCYLENYLIHIGVYNNHV